MVAEQKNQESNPLEEEINLREYVEVLIRSWYWIVGAGLLAAVLTFAFSSFMPKVYEAEARVLVTGPLYQLNFDPRFKTTEEIELSGKALADLATSGDLLQDLLEQIDPPLPATRDSVKGLKQMLQATLTGDLTLLQLKVQSEDPEEAARVANIWATYFSAWVNSFYGENGSELAQIESGLAESQSRLETAERDLIEFQARNQAEILQTQLDVALSAQQTYLGETYSTNLFVWDAETIRGMLDAQPGTEAAALGNDLMLLMLQLQAVDSGFVNGDLPQEALDVQLQVGSESMSGKSNQELKESIDEFLTGLENKSSQVEIELTSLEPQILDLQRQLQEYRSEEANLIREFDLAEETYKTLARKVDEIAVSSQAGTGKVKLVSMATVPQKPVSPRRLFNTVVAGVAGVVLAVLVVLLVVYWRKEPTTDESPGPSGS